MTILFEFEAKLVGVVSLSCYLVVGKLLCGVRWHEPR